MPKELSVVNTKPLTEKEKQTLNSMIKPGAVVEVLIPAEIDAKEWASCISVVCRAYVKAQRQEQTLLPVIGRLLVVARDNRAMWESETCSKFDDFLEGEVLDRFGIGRSTAYEAMKIVDRWPFLQVQEYEAVGRANFRILQQAVIKGNESNKTSIKLLEQAKELSVQEFRELCEKKRYIESGQSEGAFIRIPTNRAIERKWKRFAADEQIQAYCDTPRPDKILERMMQECESEWIAQAKESVSRVNGKSQPVPGNAREAVIEVRAERG